MDEKAEIWHSWKIQVYMTDSRALPWGGSSHSEAQGSECLARSARGPQQQTPPANEQASSRPTKPGPKAAWESLEVRQDRKDQSSAEHLDVLGQ